MRIEQHIVAAWAEQLADKLTQDVIDALQKMDSTAMLSGDSELKNERMGRGLRTGTRRAVLFLGHLCRNDGEPFDWLCRGVDSRSTHGVVGGVRSRMGLHRGSLRR